MPKWLPPSACADLKRLLAGAKPAVRLYAGVNVLDLRHWARRQGLFISTDIDGYAAVSRLPWTARRVIDLDRRPGRHTMALGTLLGYPSCCSRAAARVGDEGIDRRHEVLVARRFHGRFQSINPRGYTEGTSLVSHVPCSPTCAASLSLTRQEPC